MLTKIMAKDMTEAEKLVEEYKDKFDRVHIFKNYQEGREFIVAPENQNICIIGIP